MVQTETMAQVNERLLDLIADDVARQILEICSDNEYQADEITEKIGVSEATVRRRLKGLTSVGLMDANRNVFGRGGTVFSTNELTITINVGESGVVSEL